MRSYIIIDCRFPYEFEGGHIEVSFASLFSLHYYPTSSHTLTQGAVNIHEPHEIQSLFQRLPNADDTAIVLHCEFSSERAPRM